MTTSDPIEALESINADYNELLMSHEYRVGKRAVKLSTAIRHFDVKSLGIFAKSIRNQKQLKKLYGITTTHNTSNVCQSEIGEARRCSKTLFTCITKGYDIPYAPIYTTPNLSCTVFADEMTRRTIPVDPAFMVQAVEQSDLLACSEHPNRFCKMHPNDFFDSDFTIYTDGNVQIVSDIAEWCAIARASKVGIAMHAHSERECAYEEARACLISKRGNAEAIRKQMLRYESIGFPHNFGLFEATVIVTDLRNPRSHELLNAWWDEYMATESGRDQLSLPFVLWKRGYSIDSIGCLGPNVWKSPKLRIINAGSHSFRK